MHVNPTTVTVYQGPAGDHNTRAVGCARLVGSAVAARRGIETSIAGPPSPVLNAGWTVELEPLLARLAGR